jgi:lactoylglutathione lyase
MNKLSFILMLILTSLFINKSEAQTSQKKEPARLNHIAMYVTDLEKTAHFYTSIFNLPIIEEPFKQGTHVWLSLGGSVEMHLIKSDQKRIEHAKSDHLCFSVNSIEEFTNKLKEHKINYGDWNGKPNEVTVRVDGVKQIFLQDPDGHWLEVNDVK